MKERVYLDGDCVRGLASTTRQGEEDAACRGPREHVVLSPISSTPRTSARQYRHRLRLALGELEQCFGTGHDSGG